MKTRNIVILVLFGFLATCGSFVGLIFYATSGVTDAGNAFFEAARKHDYEAAYALTSESLKRRESKEDIKAFIEARGFDEVVDTSWSSRSIKNDTGTLSGSLTTETGGTIPIEIGLVHEMDEWKINSISPAKAGLEGASRTTARNPSGPDIDENVPSDANPAQLLFLNAGGFISSMEESDFDFWRLRWVDGTKGADLAARYPGTPELVERLLKLERVRPRIKSAQMNEAGQLLVTGVSEDPESSLIMELKLELEDGRWKLTDFNYQLK
ncbi:MAG: hypothetical protein P8J20_05030 [Novosphingobium sp.]|nr:hypothetical protein [Novosphingobium sp.]